MADDPNKKPGDGDHMVDKLVEAHKAAGVNSADSSMGRHEIDMAFGELTQVDRAGNIIKK